jgi:hypothetical protein
MFFRTTMKLVIALFFFPFGFLSAQIDTLYIKGDKADTIIITKPPVQLSRKLEVKEYQFKEVKQFFFIRPYFSYLSFYCDCQHSSSSVNAQAFCYSVKEKAGYNIGLELAYKFKRYNILIGYSYYQFHDRVYDYKDTLYDNNKYTQFQLSIKFMYEFTVKKIKLVPYIGFSYAMMGNTKTIYPVLSNNKIVFESVSDLQKAGNILLNAGLDFRFFSSSRFSPFISLGFARSLTYEGNEKKYDVQFIRYIYTGAMGVMVKF